MTEVAQILATHGVILVHCSGDVKGVGTVTTNSYSPIERLVNCVEHRPDVSCSTVKVGDSLSHQDPLQKNFYGPLGLIIDPLSFANITLAYPNDAGSSFCEVTKKRTGGRGLGRNTENDVCDAITKRGTVVEANYPATGWNEICCHNFKIVGLYACQQSMRFAVPNGVVTYSLADVGKALPDLPLYFGDPEKGKLVRLKWNSSSNSYATPKFLDWCQVYQEPDRF